MSEYSEGFSAGWSSLLKSYTWDRGHEKGPNAHMIKISTTSNRTVKLSLKCIRLINNSDPYNSMTDTPILSV